MPHLAHLALRTLTAGLVLQLAFGLVFAWGSFVPFVRSEWHWSPILIGAVFSGTPFGYGVGTLVGGRLADRLPARQICWLGVAVLAVGFGIAFIFPTGFTFVVFYSALALGFGGGMALTGAVAVASRVLPQSIGMVGGGLTAAYATSVIFEAPLVALLAPRIGWFLTLRLLGLGMAAVAALVLLWMPPIPARIHSSPDPPSSQIQLIRRTTVWTSMLMLFSSATLGSYAAIDLAPSSTSPLQSADAKVGSGIAASHPASLAGRGCKNRDHTCDSLRSQLLSMPRQYSRGWPPEPRLQTCFCFRQRLCGAASGCSSAGRCSAR